MMTEAQKLSTHEYSLHVGTSVAYVCAYVNECKCICLLNYT